MIVYLIASWCYPDVDQGLVLMLTREGWFLFDVLVLSWDVLGCFGFSGTSQSLSNSRKCQPDKFP